MPASDSARRPPSASATSTSSAARSPSPARCSEPPAAGSTSAHPSTAASGEVYLAPSLVDLLAQHVAGHCPKGYWIFTGETGEPPHQNSIGYRWRTTLTAAGLTGVKLHDLRHFYASGLIASGCDVVTVQRSLGHAAATTTLNTYSHLWPTAEDRTRRAAEQLFADSCAPAGLIQPGSRKPRWPVNRGSGSQVVSRGCEALNASGPSARCSTEVHPVCVDRSTAQGPPRRPPPSAYTVTDANSARCGWLAMTREPEILATPPEAHP
ncbi:tyrosine-type recombinase/integrase [Geodermatophilus sp. CPCC 206100]